GGKVLANGGSNGGAGIGGGGLSAVSGGTIKVRNGLCNPSDPTDDTYDVVANPGTGATGIGTGSRGGSVDVDLEADIPEPAYDPAPSLRLTAKSPTTPWEEVSYTETSLVYSFKDTARTVTISPNAFLNTLSEVELDESAGAKALNVNGLPGGDYAVKTLETTIPTPGSAVLTGTYGFETALPDILTVEAGAADGLEDLTNNANILFEVTAADATAGTVTLKATANLMGTDGTSQTRLVREGLVLSEGTAFALTGFDLSGTGLEPKAEEANPAVKLTLQPGQAGGFPVGSKFVYNFTAAALSADSRTVEISGTQESTELMKSPLRFTLSADDVKNRELHFSNFYLDKDTGDVHEGEVILTTNGNALDSNATLSSFRTDARAPEPLQRAAEPDTQLRELKTFYDSSGVFLLEAPQTLTITQGDGQTVDVTLYANDTLAEVRAKLNDAIADGLGQARYVSGDASHFVSFVEQGQAQDNGPETVPGTFIVRSAVPGRAGELSFSGSQDILNALGLNTIQQSSESSYTASVYNAHTGSAIATNVKVTGNQLNGVIHKNVDVVFEPMSGITAAWNENTKAYALTGGQARLTLHLADRGMTFQTGANRGEELHVNIGAMSADALGIAGVSVATRGRAQNAIGMLDRAINRVSAQRAGIGAYQNSLEYTAENLTTAMTNLTAAESRIRDADMAQEMMELVKLQILNQSGTSMLAQANQLPQQVLSLIGG
ncbi:MAG: hypothetical protein IJ702_01895, partial [Fretibacterium sp.]|nr:hypothetical protein [Fretibacterium sp.]